MKIRFPKWMYKIWKQYGRMSTWRKIVGIMVCIVVFCTTYALILPALTLERTSDSNADVENSAVWEETLPQLSGNTVTDVISIAESQIGYAESQKNYVTDEDGSCEKGYTRYGEWYGEKYADWSGMFVAFCLNYAGVSMDEMGVNQDCNIWAQNLKSSGKYGQASEYMPKSGDIIFFDKDEDGIIESAGIVTEIVTKEDQTQEVKTVEGDLNDKVEAAMYESDDGRICGYGILPAEENTNEEEEPEAVTAAEEATADAKIQSAEEDQIAVHSESTVSGMDITKNVTNVSLKKKDGAVWKESDSFTTGDQVKAGIDIENIDVKTLKDNNYMAYIKLPEGMDCSKFVGKTFDTIDNGEKSGEYQYVQDADGNWYIQLNLDQKYVDKAEHTIGGSLEFNFQWNDNAVSDDGGKKTITLGSWSGEVTVKKDKTDDSGQTGNNYSLKKTAGDLSYSEDGKTAYIEYTVELTVNKDTPGPIEVNDKLTGKNWNYSGDSLQIKTADGQDTVGSWNINSDNGSSVIKVGNEGEMIKAGVYRITYRVQNENITNPKNQSDSSVSNEAFVKDDKNTLKDTTYTRTGTGTISKDGKRVETEDGTSYIEWTVYLNSGDIVKNLENGMNFSDTLSDELELVGDVSVSQFDVNGSLIKTDTASVNGSDISYKTPAGQYYYVITYKTKVKDTVEIPAGGKDISNTAKVTGDMEGTDTKKVTIPNHIVNKTFSKQEVLQKDGKWVDLLDWQTVIDVKGSLKEYVYEDYAGTVYQDGNHKCPLSMTDDQWNGIKLVDANGKTVDPEKYQISKSDHKENGVTTGLFKIKFTGDVTGPVTIKYQTTADMTLFNVGSWISFTNYATVTDGKGNKDDSSASSNTIEYQHGNPDVIAKYGNNSQDIAVGSSNITLQPGETTIPWTIAVNNGRSLSDDLIVTDTIASDMTFVEDSLNVSIWGGSIKDKVAWKFDKAERKLTVTIPKEVYTYNGGSNPVVISYRTELDKSFFDRSDIEKTYTNTASVTANEETTDSTFSQNVTRQVVGKSGSFDKKNNLLTYNIVLNPEGSVLNDGKNLQVTDAMDAGSIKDNVTLNSLSLFTALKTTDSNGNVKIEAGAFVKDLTKSNQAGLYNYSYDKATNTFVTYVPDGTAYVMVAEYMVEADVAEAVQMKNAVQLSGIQTWSARDDSAKVEQDTSGETHKNQDMVTIVKHDASQNSLLLSGAEFKLESYSKGTWQNLNTLVTDQDGKASQIIKRNILYRLTETKAPDEYIKDESPTYFILVEEGTTPNLPDNISDDPNYKASEVLVKTVKEGNKEYANIIINRYNAKDKTVVHKGELRVNKIWKDGSGNDITDPVELAKMPEINVTLTKHEPVRGHTVTIKEGNWDNAKKVTLTDLPYGCSIQVKIRSNAWQPDINQFQCSDSNVTMKRSEYADENGNYYIYTIGTINSDCTITNGALANTDKQNFSHIGGQKPTGITDTIIDTVTLNAANDWSYLWKDLPNDEDTSYTIKEESVSGYTTSYQLNGSELKEDISFALGEEGDRVTITNKAAGSYVLPETGGIGTKKVILAGLLLLVVGLLYGYKIKRKTVLKEE